MEAVVNGITNDTQSKTIANWLDGSVVYSGDNSTGQDIYKFEFAPRFSTKNNPSWYVWHWVCIEEDCANRKVVRNWEDNIQNGGAFMMSTYFDILTRLKTKGSDNAHERLDKFLHLYSAMQNSGGYRHYFKDKRFDVQGCNKAGLVGVDCEFTDSALVPMTALYGFLGIDATSKGLEINPKLATKLETLGVLNLMYHGILFDIKVVNSPSDIRFDYQLGKIIINLNRNDRALIPIDIDNYQLKASEIFNRTNSNTETVTINPKRLTDFVVIYTK
jgi:hypothetical protein